MFLFNSYQFFPHDTKIVFYLDGKEIYSLQIPLIKSSPYSFLGQGFVRISSYYLDTPTSAIYLPLQKPSDEEKISSISHYPSIRISLKLHNLSSLHKIDYGLSTYRFYVKIFYEKKKYILLKGRSNREADRLNYITYQKIDEFSVSFGIVPACCELDFTQIEKVLNG